MATIHIKDEDMKQIEDSLKNILVWFDGFETGRGKATSLNLKILYLLKDKFHESTNEQF